MAMFSVILYFQFTFFNVESSEGLFFRWRYGYGEEEKAEGRGGGNELEYFGDEAK